MICSGGARVGDPGEALQVAEPQHGADLLGDAALDVAAQHAMPGVAAEIGLDQRLGDARGRGALDREREDWAPETRARRDRRRRSPRAIGRPGGVGAVHHADRAVRAEAVDHRDVVGHAALRAAPPAPGTAAARWRGAGAAWSRRSRRAGGTGSAATCPRCARDRAGRTRTGPGRRRRAPNRTRGPRAPDAACRRRTPRGRAAGPRRARARRSLAADSARAGRTGRRRRATRAVAESGRSPWARLRCLVACGRGCGAALLPEPAAQLKPARPTCAELPRSSSAFLPRQASKGDQRRTGALAP